MYINVAGLRIGLHKLKPNPFGSSSLPRGGRGGLVRIIVAGVLVELGNCIIFTCLSSPSLSIEIGLALEDRS